MPSKNCFDITCLKSEVLQRLFHEVTSYVQNVRIEEVIHRKGHGSVEEHPATTLGLTHKKPTVQFVDSLNRGQRIEAIAHELVHLLLVYRFGLGVIGRRIPRHGNREDILSFLEALGYPREDFIFFSEGKKCNPCTRFTA